MKQICKNCNQYDSTGGRQLVGKGFCLSSLAHTTIDTVYGEEKERHALVDKYDTCKYWIERTTQTGQRVQCPTQDIFGECLKVLNHTKMRLRQQVQVCPVCDGVVITERDGEYSFHTHRDGRHTITARTVKPITSFMYLRRYLMQQREAMRKYSPHRSKTNRPRRCCMPHCARKNKKVDWHTGKYYCAKCWIAHVKFATKAFRRKA